MNKKPIQCSAPVTASARLKLRCDYREDDFEYWPRPSELQLAHLAAQLARTQQIDPKQLVGDAWALYWESCRVIKNDYREVANFIEHLETGWEDYNCYEENGPERIPIGDNQFPSVQGC